MNTSSKKVEGQSMVAPTARRSFMRKVGAVAGAVLTAAVPAQASQVERRPDGFVKMPPIDPLQQMAEYNIAILSHMCLTAHLMREWFDANEDTIRAAMPDQATKLYDFATEASASARHLAKVANVQYDAEYVAQRVAEYKKDAVAGAGKAAQAGRPVTRQQRELVRHFNNMKESAQATLVDVAEEWAESLPRVVAGGAA